MVVSHHREEVLRVGALRLRITELAKMTGDALLSHV